MDIPHFRMAHSQTDKEFFLPPGLQTTRWPHASFMRIFLSCQQSPVRHPIPAYGFWEGYFKRGIEEAGHTWIEAKGADWAAGLLPQSKEDLAHWREKTWNLTFKSLRAA